MNTLGTTATDDPLRGPRPIEVALLASVFVVAACGLIYELAAGALADTVIERGVRLDNLIHIAHNCRVGAHTAMAACVGVAGSTSIGANCMIGGAAMISGHLKIGDRVLHGTIHQLSNP